MPLTEDQVAEALVRQRAYKLADTNGGAGMYLLVKPNGGKYWRFDYRFAGKRKTLALGVWPVVSLTAARKKRVAARSFLAHSIDPGERKHQQHQEEVALAHAARKAREQASIDEAFVARVEHLTVGLVVALHNRQVSRKLRDTVTVSVVGRLQAVLAEKNGNGGG